MQDVSLDHHCLLAGELIEVGGHLEDALAKDVVRGGGEGGQLAGQATLVHLGGEQLRQMRRYDVHRVQAERKVLVKQQRHQVLQRVQVLQHHLLDALEQMQHLRLQLGDHRVHAIVVGRGLVPKRRGNCVLYHKR